MIGHELGGRYEIITRIGSGGMALVYKAQDILLNRHVAVKVLRQQFVHDEEFVRRFRREAQSAAALSHPNVVSIYDVGQEDETHYIVMEYVEGSNLNEIILERAPLQAEEAVRIAAQICDALEHAHANQIIHRDIKPHNILIGNNGRVKVTDFGIARAVTSSTITQTGSVVGSVHYFSPEHAKGVATGEKSDLYSLGIVLYQMLTGRLPFLGESPISVALKHLQDDFEQPRLVNPHIPQSVENIILRSMRKSPAERYSSAREMLFDLETCLQTERLQEPKVSFHDHDMDATRVMPAIRGTGESKADAAPQHERERQAARSDSEAVNRWDTRGLEEEPARRRWVKPLITIIVTLLFLALLFWGFKVLLNIFDTDEVDVPYVIGKTQEEAVGLLEQSGLKLEEPIVYEVRDDFDKDIVFDQTKQNMRVKAGSTVKLYVSLGPDLEMMENYVGKRYVDTRNALMALGVDELRITSEEIYNEQQPGTIVSQSFASGTEFDPKTVEIHFEVSQGLETFDMPKLIGLTENEAVKAIRDSELALGPGSGVVRQSSYLPEGQVLEQFPYEPGEAVSKGTEVSITVSSGLPSDALRHTFKISISPAQAGQSSEIRIEYSDARGDKQDWGTRTIEDTQTFSVETVLAPDTEAVVTVYRNNQYTDSFSKTYDEVKAGVGSAPETVPGNEPPPEEQPVVDATAMDADNDSDDASEGENDEQE